MDKLSYNFNWKEKTTNFQGMDCGGSVVRLYVISIDLGDCKLTNLWL